MPAMATTASTSAGGSSIAIPTAATASDAALTRSLITIASRRS